MAIAFDAATTPTKATSGTTLNLTHTCSGSNRILFVGVSAFFGSSGTCTGVTYNGVAMTKIDSIAAQPNADLSLWYLIAPATGSHTVTATASSSVSVMYVTAASYTGANQSGVPDSSNKGNGTATSRTVSTTTVLNNCWVVGIGATGAASITASAGMTSRSERDDVSSSVLLADSNGVKSPAGSYSMTFTNPNDSTGLVIASFAPVQPTSDVFKKRSWIGSLIALWDNARITIINAFAILLVYKFLTIKDATHRLKEV